MADIKQIAEKVNGAKNILVALSKNPNVDEVSAALGLTLMLDKLGKKATAIYSGKTPNVLRFLNPEKTFSTDTNALQDFIISLDKEKADHLRYKVDGDYVKVFITPYHEAISEDDLEYSYGDFNVDLIIALGVAEEGDLDGALVEYGRIMHDAGVVNITTKEGGKFSETEWSNPSASSVSEMIAELGVELGGEAFEKDSATALLTGIVASTERFAKENTTPETMGVASKLMKAGADQSLVAENIERAEEGKEPIMMESENGSDSSAEKESSSEEGNKIKEMEEPEMETIKSAPEMPVEEPKAEELEVPAEEPKTPEVPAEEPKVETPEAPESSTEEQKEEPVDEPQKPVLETPSELLSDMPKAAEPETPAEEPKVKESEAPAEEPKVETPEAPAEEPKVETPEAPAEEPKTPEAPAEEPKVEVPELPKATGPAPEDTMHKSVKLQPSTEAQAELEKLVQEKPKKNELLEEMNKESERLAQGGLKPDVGLSSIDTDSIGKSETKDYSQMMAAALDGDGGMPNPAVQATPAVMMGPEENHIPEMDYSQPVAAEAEQPPVMQNGMLEPVAPATEPAGVAHEGMMAATDMPTEQAPGMVTANEGMNGDILPPPPAPPVDGGIMPPVETTAPATPVVAAEPTPVAPTEVAPVEAPIPATPVAPEPITTPSSAAPVTPVVPVAPVVPETPVAPEVPTQVGPTPTTDDPSAFRIPGM